MSKDKAKELERKAKLLRRQQKLKKQKQKTIVAAPKTPVEVKNKFIILARARRPIVREDTNIIEALKWVLSQIPKDDLYEVHDANDKLVWGRSTGLIKENYKESYGK